MLKAAQAYFQTQVNTTSQGDLLLMLYDGAIKYLRQAKVKIEEKDFAAKGILISKALDIISELDGSLNPNKGGDLAEKLHNLYFFCTMRLFNANLKMDVKLIDEVLLILSGLRDAYGQIVSTYGGAMPTEVQADQSPAPAAPQAQAKGPAPEGGSQAMPKPAPQPTAGPVSQGQPMARITPKKVPADQAKQADGTPAAPKAATHQAQPKPEPQPAPQATPQEAPAMPETGPKPAQKMGRGANLYRKMSQQA